MTLKKGRKCIVKCSKPTCEPEGKGGGDYLVTVWPASVPVWPEAMEESMLSLTSNLTKRVTLRANHPQALEGFIYLASLQYTGQRDPWPPPKQSSAFRLFSLTAASSHSLCSHQTSSMEAEEYLSPSWQHLHVYNKGGYRTCLLWTTVPLKKESQLFFFLVRTISFSFPIPSLYWAQWYPTLLSFWVSMQSLLSRKQETPFLHLLFQEWVFPEIGLKLVFAFVLFV